MKVTKRSGLTGIIHTREISISEEDYTNGLLKIEGGMLIQDAFPQLNPGDREFLLTGCTPEEWESISSEI